MQPPLAPPPDVSKVQLPAALPPGRGEEAYLGGDECLSAAKGVSQLDPAGLQHYHFERFTASLEKRIRETEAKLDIAQSENK